MEKEFSYPRDFKGIFIPKEIYLDDDLSAIEMIILSEIYSLDVEGSDGCYASNEYLANFCKCGVTKVSNAITKLKNMGYITSVKTDGRTRWIKVDLQKKKSRYTNKTGQTCKKCKSEIQKVQQSNIDNNIDDNNNTLSVERAESASKKQKNSQIKANRMKEANALFEKLWSLYPLKKGKGQVSDTQKLKLLDIGYEELERAISRYIQYVDSVDYLHYKNGSTFFNSGYIDYLDANYVPEKEKKKEKKNTFQNFQQRDYDFEALERQLLLS